MSTDQALLVVDVQRDFCPGGALPVPAGDAVVPIMNRYMRAFDDAGAPIFASRDWHPARTSHFREWGGEWPPHCVQQTEGAEFHPKLDLPARAIIVSKGQDPDQDSYSAFDATTEDGIPLADALRRRGVRSLYVGGLATDYCVRASVLDARREGFEVTLLADASRGIDVKPGDVSRAVDEMRHAGATEARYAEVAQRLEGTPSGRSA